MSTCPTKDLSTKLDRVVELNAPPLEELLPVLSHGIQEHFAETSVEIVECPDLSLDPFNFSGHGISKDLRIAETIAETCNLPECFIFGPGAGPRQKIEVNCEMVADAVFDPLHSKINTHICKIAKTNTYKQEETTDPCFGLMANLGICSNEKAGPVLKITAHKRTGDLNFPESIRQTLLRHYGAKLVSFAGVFLIEDSTILAHVMPDFPAKDFFSRDELQNEWLQFFEMKSPAVCASVFHTTDPDLDLRLEHTHFFSKHGDSGHYHYDTSPDTVNYTGYFRPAEVLYRIDQVDIHGREIDLV
ncbi:Ester hydrolase C11orf54-like protein [Aphelenchoides bicaudatus]|nr:Ester hydrolase C11orf54-like protein [Aphelenchoides bicaudatus]